LPDGLEISCRHARVPRRALAAGLGFSSPGARCVPTGRDMATRRRRADDAPVTLRARADSVSGTYTSSGARSGISETGPRHSASLASLERRLESPAATLNLSYRFARCCLTAACDAELVGDRPSGCGLGEDVSVEQWAAQRHEHVPLAGSQRRATVLGLASFRTGGTPCVSRISPGRREGAGRLGDHRAGAPAG
jgi:hypothetical protein